jgi:hypothetical protein
MAQKSLDSSKREKYQWIAGRWSSPQPDGGPGYPLGEGTNMANKTKGTDKAVEAKVEAVTAGTATVGGHYRTASGKEVIVEAIPNGGNIVIRHAGTKRVQLIGASVALTEIPEAEWTPDRTPAVRVPKARVRDPRLPVPGTPIIRRWRGHECVAVERDDGAFVVGIGGEPLEGTFPSLRKAAEAVVATAGIKTGQNGMSWWRLAAPTARDLRLRVEDLEARFAKAVERAAHLETELDTARKALADRKAN